MKNMIIFPNGMKIKYIKKEKIDGIYFVCDICNKETNRGIEIITKNGDVYHFGNTCFRKNRK